MFGIRRHKEQWLRSYSLCELTENHESEIKKAIGGESS